MDGTDLIADAARYARLAHAGQVRRYTGLAYINHPAEVAALVERVSRDPVLIAAAWLHDVVEDTPATLLDLALRFGLRVARLVGEVTDVSRPADGNRARRKALDRAYLAEASRDGQTLKYADLISNTAHIAAHDPAFAAVYLAEKEALMAVMTRGHPLLRDMARASLRDARDTLERQAAAGKGATP